MEKLILVVVLLALTQSAPADDKMTRIPGYSPGFSTNMYAGYLDVGNANRSLHYVFVESINGSSNADPVTLWLNGGPGCSSLLGFLLEIGPYYLEDGVDYKMGDKLTQNPHSWHKASNILFLESPAGVGYSYNLDTSFQYNDSVTASDSFNALLSFYQKYPEYKKNKFFIAGESYAGKYIPDLAVLIDKYNLKQQAANRLNLVAILVGNGVMSFQTLEQSSIEYIIKKEMVDPEILTLYEKYCLKDFESDECGVFLRKYDKDTEGLNPYDIYGYCFYNNTFDQNKQKRKRPLLTQERILTNLKNDFARRRGHPPLKDNQGPPCGYFDGVFNYFNLHTEDFHARFKDQVWNGPCAQNITYNIDPKGSIESYKYLLNYFSTARKYEIVLYNGNADAVVPYLDTYKGLQMLNLMKLSNYEPWFTDNQHSGFQQQYSGLLFVIFKGGSHQVPQSKRAAAFKFFKGIVTNYRAEPFSQLTVDQS